MKLQLKKYIYLVNDITNALLSKESADLKKQIKDLKMIILILGLLLASSLLINLCFLF